MSHTFRYICSCNIKYVLVKEEKEKKKKKIYINKNKKILPGGESNPGLPRDRRGYLPLYYRGHVCRSETIGVDPFVTHSWYSSMPTWWRGCSLLPSTSYSYRQTKWCTLAQEAGKILISMLQELEWPKSDLHQNLLAWPLSTDLWPLLWPRFFKPISGKACCCAKYGENAVEHRWSSGRILACHAGDPGSIPGRCMFLIQTCWRKWCQSEWLHIALHV